jgi:hypothetical protein
MAISESDIDELYKLPLAGFTAARNDLAKRAGPRAPAIKQLEKPHVAVWAVNQLYWRQRVLYDRLIAASTRMRHAHAQRLTGKQADVASTEAAHRDVFKEAVAAAKDILTGASEAASPATISAISETLRALPTEDAAGRLSRPLQPPGLDALARMLRGSTRSTGSAVLRFPARQKAVRPAEERKTIDTKTIDAPARQAAAKALAAREAALEAAREKREADARKREVARLTRELQSARTSERKARALLSTAEASLERAEEHRQQARTRVAEATTQLTRLESALAAIRG